jgi:hypothetical protein
MINASIKPLGNTIFVKNMRAICIKKFWMWSTAELLKTNCTWSLKIWWNSFIIQCVWKPHILFMIITITIAIKLIFFYLECGGNSNQHLHLQHFTSRAIILLPQSAIWHRTLSVMTLGTWLKVSYKKWVMWSYPSMTGCIL